MRTFRPFALLVATSMLTLVGCGGGTPSASPVAPAAGPAAPAAGSTAPPAGGSATAGKGGTTPERVPERLRFSGSTIDGRAFSGESLAGRPAVLWFWAPWCTVCRGEAPDIDAMQRRFGDRVQFVGVPGLGPVPDMQRFVADTGLGGFPHVVDADGKLWERFGVPAQPAFAFVGRDGTVEVSVGKLSVEDLSARLDRLAQG